MKNVEVHILLYELETYLEPPDAVDDTWGSFAHPDDETKGLFNFTDQEGDISIIVNHTWSISVVVKGKLPDEIIDSPALYHREHYLPVLRFYIRAFEAVNHFISRFRIRLFKYENAPINWSIREAIEGAQIGAFLAIHSKTNFKEEWYIEGKPFDMFDALKIKIKHEWSRSLSPIGYDPGNLRLVAEDVQNLINNKEVNSSTYDVCSELLMQAQELVGSENRSRKDERHSAIGAALIATHSAWEVFVKTFIKQHGTPLHRHILDKQAFSVSNLLYKVLADMSAFRKPLKVFNPELAHNLELLVRARNDAVHSAAPVLKFERKYVKETIKQAGITKKIPKKENTIRIPIAGWMIHSEPRKHLYFSDTEGETGSFVWDVLALIDWLQVKMGGQWSNEWIRKYWEAETSKPVKTREQEIICLYMNRKR
jgi:hypothetical protein